MPILKCLHAFELVWKFIFYFNLFVYLQYVWLFRKQYSIPGRGSPISLHSILFKVKRIYRFYPAISWLYIKHWRKTISRIIVNNSAFGQYHELWWICLTLNYFLIRWRDQVFYILSDKRYIFLVHLNNFADLLPTLKIRNSLFLNKI